MYAKLTYILSCIVLLATSCTSDLPDSPAEGGVEMAFDVAALSRASVTTSIDKFSVFADMRLAGEEVRQPIVFLNNTEVKFISNQWTYEGTHYWMPKFEHTFIAVHPTSVVNNGTDPLYSNSRLSFTYTIPTDKNGKLARHTDVKDILAATHRRVYADMDPDNTVKFTFSHILSLINLAPAVDGNVGGGDGYVEIHKIVLSGFKTKATFNLLPAPRQSNNRTDDRVINVTDTEGEGSLEIQFANPIKVTKNSDNIRLFDNNDALVMLPQKFNSDSGAKISVYYKICGQENMQNGTLPLNNLEWKSGSSYSYRFSISMTGIIMNGCNIVSWNPVEGDPITVD